MADAQSQVLNIDYLSLSLVNSGWVGVMRLKVEGFSCIQYAELELRPYTVVIGEQGSGKELQLHNQVCSQRFEAFFQ